jgi:hypothetical protein
VLPALIFSLILSAQAAAKSKPAGVKAPVSDAETVVIPAGGSFDKLVVVEARQQVQPEKARRIISIIPGGILTGPVSLYVAQKNLAEPEQIQTGTATWLAGLADFSAPRLAVYDDRNPCVREDSKPEDGAKAKQPTMSVAGVPSLPGDPEATAEAVLVSVPGLKKQSRGLSPADVALLTELGNKGYALIRVTFKSGGRKQAQAMLGAALQLAVESVSAAPKIDINGSREFLVERYFLGPETAESLPGLPMSRFPTGTELPHETAAVWPQAYHAWVAGELKSGNGIARFAGPVNRCDVCYQQPLTADQLKAAGVFWSTGVSARHAGNLRSKAAPAATGYDTWLTRHLVRKKARVMLTLISDVTPATISAQFVEQGSVQRPFHGEIFCPAMDGYQKSLRERREKTIAALNGLSSWTEKDLAEAYAGSGGKGSTWYQDHFQK